MVIVLITIIIFIIDILSVVLIMPYKPSPAHSIYTTCSYYNAYYTYVHLIVITLILIFTIH